MITKPIKLFLVVFIFLKEITMLTIQIKDGENKVIAVVNNVYNVSIDEEINKGGKLSMKIPVEERMRKQKIKK
jgi:hypothetical protein